MKMTDFSQKEPVSAAIVGARGYSGLELARLLLKHPGAELKACLATDAKWKLSDYLPEAAAKKVPVLAMSELPSLAKEVKVVFLATPVEVSLEWAPKLLKAGVDVIDLSGAFRLKAGTVAERREKYKKWYGLEHPCPEQLEAAEYGLVPWVGPAKNSGPHLISNPGCYATSVLMALLPLLKEGVVLPETIVIDAKSGTSGAGKKADESLLFTEVDGECLPYKVGKHQHLPEITEWVSHFTNIAIDPFFTSHLLPVRRGIISSIYARLSQGVNVEAVSAAYSKHYSDYPLVEVGTSARLRSLKRVVGSARVQINFDVTDNKLFVFSLIDNLLKGAASQAVENFNRLADSPVGMGLDTEGTL